MPLASFTSKKLEPLVIGKNWFLAAGGFVRIQDSSQVWEERVDETRIITMERSSHMPGLRARMDNH